MPTDSKRLILHFQILHLEPTASNNLKTEVRTLRHPFFRRTITKSVANYIYSVLSLSCMGLLSISAWRLHFWRSYLEFLFFTSVIFDNFWVDLNQYSQLLRNIEVKSSVICRRSYLLQSTFTSAQFCWGDRTRFFQQNSDWWVMNGVGNIGFLEWNQYFFRSPIHPQLFEIHGFYSIVMVENMDDYPRIIHAVSAKHG